MAGTPGRSGGNRNMGSDRTPFDGLPEPPSDRSEAFYRKWAAIVPDLPVQSLRRIDAVQVAILIEQLVEIDELTKHIEANPGDLKSRSLRLRVSQQVSRLSSQFGLSPADRNRLNFEQPSDESDPFDDYLKRRLEKRHSDPVDEWSD